MSVDTSIEHTGIIDSIGDKSVFVRFTSFSACASCHAKSHCSASEMEDKVVEVIRSREILRMGEQVNVILSVSQGYKALLIGYVYPFIIVISSLIIFSAFGFKELFTGLFSLSLLIPYYLFIKYFNKSINKKFQFTIRKSDTL